MLAHMIYWKVEKVDASAVYDALDLSFNTVDKTSKIKAEHVDIIASLNLKALYSCVYTKQYMYDFNISFTNSLNSKSDNLYTYSKVDVKVCLSILEAGIHRQVWINGVYSDGKFKINDVYNDIQIRVDCSILYDAFELSFNPVDKTNI